MAFSVLLLVLLSLPLLLSLTRPPSREQAFLTVSEHAGPIGMDAAEIFEDPKDADILFVGNSRVLWGIEEESVETALSLHLGRPAHVVKLVNNWPGEDIHCVMLENYLEHHRARLIVYMLPQPNATFSRPWVQIYHLVRFPLYRSILGALPLVDRVALYGNMILGAPKELLAKLRPNRVGSDEKTFAHYARFSHFDPLFRVGYGDRSFTPDSLPPPSPSELHLLPITSPLLSVAGPAPGEYELYFVHQFIHLAQQHGSSIVLLHMPDLREYGKGTIPQLADWSTLLGTDFEMIGLPSAVLFQGLSHERVLDFYVDGVHFNLNGRKAFAARIIPSLLKAYDAVPSRMQSQANPSPSTELFLKTR